MPMCLKAHSLLQMVLFLVDSRFNEEWKPACMFDCLFLLIDNRCPQQQEHPADTTCGGLGVGMAQSLIHLIFKNCRHGWDIIDCLLCVSWKLGGHDGWGYTLRKVCEQGLQTQLCWWTEGARDSHVVHFFHVLVKLGGCNLQDVEVC